MNENCEESPGEEKEKHFWFCIGLPSFGDVMFFPFLDHDVTVEEKPIQDGEVSVIPQGIFILLSTCSQGAEKWNIKLKSQKSTFEWLQESTFEWRHVFWKLGSEVCRLYLGDIYLAHAENLQTYVFVLGESKKSFSKNIAYIVIGWSQGVECIGATRFNHAKD